MPNLSDDAFRRAVLLQVEGEMLRETGNLRERVVALDSAGRVVFAKTGSSHEIGFTRDDLAAMAGRAVLVTHNHDDSSAFSVEDLSLALFLDLPELNVFGPVRRWRLLRGSAGWPDQGLLRAAFRRADRQVRRALMLAQHAGHYDGNPFSWEDRGGAVWRRLQRDHPDWFILAEEERSP